MDDKVLEKGKALEKVNVSIKCWMKSVVEGWCVFVKWWIKSVGEVDMSLSRLNVKSDLLCTLKLCFMSLN